MVRHCTDTFPAPFIIGASRSGTTLLRLMLDAHPDISIPSETHFLSQLLEANSLRPMSRRSFYDFLAGFHTWNDFEIDENVFWARLVDLEPFTVSDGLRCFYLTYASRFNKRRWGDKTPIYLRSIKAISNCLPEVHFIHVIRDGRDVALSKRRLWFGPGKDIKSQARDWVSKVSEVRRTASGMSNYLELRYEDLVVDPETVLRDVARFLRVAYSSSMLDYHKNASGRLNEIKNWYGVNGTLSVPRSKQIAIHDLTSSPPVTERVGRWRQEMSVDEVCEFEEIAGQLLVELNYELGSKCS